MSRKTVKLSELVRYANQQLLRTDSFINREARLAICHMIEFALFEADVYSGFRYLIQSELPPGALPGVRYDDNGMILEYPQRFENTDDSRRHYFYNV